MAAYISKSWEVADQIQYAQTTETTDSAVSTWYIFDALDEPAAMAALRAQAPTTYAIGDRSVGASAYSITARLAQTIWQGSVSYSNGSAGQSIGGQFYFNGNGYPETTLGLTLDLVTPADARTGGSAAWYIDGAYQSSGLTFPVPEDALGKELLCVYSHPRYTGELTKSMVVGNGENLGGAIHIIGLPPVQAEDPPVTLSANLSEVWPAPAQANGNYNWIQGGATISTTATATVSSPGAVRLVYTHNDYQGSLKADTNSGGGGGGGSGDSHPHTVSFSLDSSTTTRLYFYNSDVVRHGEWNGYEIKGYNPDENGNPQGAEFLDPGFNFSHTIWRKPGQVTDSFINNLSLYAGTINSGNFLGFPPGTVMFLGASGNLSGDSDSDWWQITLNFQHRAGRSMSVKMASGNSGNPTLTDTTIKTDSGWQYVNVLTKPINQSGKKVPAVVAWNVVNHPWRFSFGWLEQEIRAR